MAMTMQKRTTEKPEYSIDAIGIKVSPDMIMTSHASTLDLSTFFISLDFLVLQAEWHAYCLFVLVNVVGSVNIDNTDNIFT